MVTPLEQDMLDALVAKLRGDEISEEIINGLVSAFHAERLPTPDEIATLIKGESGERVV